MQTTIDHRSADPLPTDEPETGETVHAEAGATVGTDDDRSLGRCASDEGLAGAFEGLGRSWRRSRSQDAVLSRLVPQRPAKGQGH